MICCHLHVLQGVEENFGGEFSVFIELSEVGFCYYFCHDYHPKIGIFLTDLCF